MKKSLSILYTLCTLLIVPLSTYRVNAQSTSFISMATTGNPQQIIDSDSVHGKFPASTYSQVWLVNLAPLPSIQVDNKVAFNLPGIDSTVYAEALNIETADNQNFSWYGKFFDEEGTVNLRCVNGRYEGVIYYDTSVFEIHYLTVPARYALARIRHQVLTGKRCQTEGIPMPEGYTPPSKVQNRSFCKVRILHLYTPQAEASVKNIQKTIVNGEYVMKNSLLNSQCGWDKIESAGIFRWNGFSEQKTYREDMATLNFDMTIHATLDALRATHQADLVVIWVGKKKDADNVIGIAHSTVAGADNYYAVVSAPQEAEYKVFAHEVGHLMGGGHENDPTKTFEHAFSTTYHKSKYMTTLLISDPFTQEKHVDHYSNPNVEVCIKRFFGLFTDCVKTGVDLPNFKADNARQISNVICGVAEYIGDPVSPLEVRLSNRMQGPPEYQYTIYSGVDGGSTPYSCFRWDMSYDGYSYFPVASQGAAIQVIYGGDGSGILSFVPHINTEKRVWFRLKVCDASAQVAYGFTSFLVCPSCSVSGLVRHDDPAGYTNAGQDLELGGMGAETVAFKQTSHEITLRYYTLGDYDADFILTDVNGRILKRQPIRLTAGEDRAISIDPGNHPTGIYFWQFCYGDKTETGKIYIQQN